MADQVTEDSTNFFRRAEYDEGYWNKYLAARPQYDDSFYQSIYEYHKSNGGDMNLAHDVGTGPGQVAAELLQHFDHVVASDNNETHLDVARQRLSTSPSLRNLTLTQCSAETLDQTHSAGSIDLITAAECVPLLDAGRALEVFATLLKPKGTLAIWFYGRPAFAEPEYASKCQPILNAILEAMFAPVIRSGGPQQHLGWQRSTNRMASFLEDVKLEEQVWQHVERRKWNSQYPMPFNPPGACDFEVVPTSRVGAAEKIVEISDPEFWQRHWDINGVRRFVQALFPTFDKSDVNPKIERKYDDLMLAMGGESAVRKIAWPVVLILASRK